MKRTISSLETRIQNLQNKQNLLKQKQALLLLKSLSQILHESFSIELATLIMQEAWNNSPAHQKEKWLNAAEKFSAPRKRKVKKTA